MPEIKISELTSAVVPSGGEILAIVQSNTTHKTTINSLKPSLVDNLSTGAPTWDVNGNLTAGFDIIAGGNHDGRVGLTINDGYGNANLTFNHHRGVPDRDGSSARISSSVDSNQELLDFQLKSSVTSGTPIVLTSVLKLYEDSIQLLKPTTLSTSGTGTTSLVNKGYIDTALSGKADTSHTHSQYSLNTHLHDDRYSQIGHSHSIGNISNLQTILNGKIGETEINTSHFTFSSNTLSLNTIQEGQIATGAVTNTKIATGAVSPSKLSTGAPSWSTAGRLTVDGEIRVGEDTGDGVPFNLIKGSRVGTLDTLILEGNDVVDIKTASGTYDSSIKIFGNGHPTVPHQIYHKADYHIFQNKEGGMVAQIPPTSTPTQDNHLVRKDYVDAGSADPARGYNNLSHATASNTIIENTTGRPLFVSFTLYSSNDINHLLLEISPNSDMTGSTRIAQTRIVSDAYADSGGQVCGIVPDGWYWKVVYSGGGSTLSEKVHCSFVL